MKKSKIFLSAFAVIAVVSSALAFEKASNKFAGEPVYHQNGQWTGCYINTPLNCSGTVAVSGDYYVVNSTVFLLDAGTQLKRLQ